MLASKPVELDPAARAMQAQSVPGWVNLAVQARIGTAKPLAVIFAPWDPEPRSNNQTRGKHWGRRAQESQDAGNVALWAFRAAGEPMFAVPVDVETLVIRCEAMDDDNAISGIKPLRDALVRRGLLPDDGPRWWRNAGVDVISNSAYRQAWTVLIVWDRAVVVAEQLEELYADAGAQLQEGGTVDFRAVERQAAALREERKAA